MATKEKPLWLAIEEALLEADVSGETEATVHNTAAKLDEAGYNVSKHSGNLLDLRWALAATRKAGRPLMKDFRECLDALLLEQAADPYKAADDIIKDVGTSFPKFKLAERRPVVIAFVQQRRLDLLIERARNLSGDKGIELLIDEDVDWNVITEAMGISEEKLKEVNAEMERRRAERQRVLGLLEKVQDKSDEEKVRYLIDNDVAEPLILELAGVDQSAIDAVNKAMEEEIKEKQRLAEEEAARKKKEAEGPALEDIPADEMLAHIEAVREIMEFSDVEKEIRTMCEQSSIPKAIVDIAVSDPDKLDELEKQAGG